LIPLYTCLHRKSLRFTDLYLGCHGANGRRHSVRG
jgi:hypothetical protein